MPIIKSVKVSRQNLSESHELEQSVVTLKKQKINCIAITVTITSSAQELCTQTGGRLCFDLHINYIQTAVNYKNLATPLKALF